VKNAIHSREEVMNDVIFWELMDCGVVLWEGRRGL
jgi:hypothetical protein